MASPDVINKDLIEKSLRTHFENKSIQILGFSTKAAVATGENYTSFLYRTNVNYSKNDNGAKETISLIIKIQPVGTQMEMMTNQMNLFSKEMEMFSKTFPLMYKALGEGTNGSLSPICLLTLAKPIKLLVLEDLQPYGFKMVDRQKGLNYDHAKLVMKKIAQFHAATAVIVDKDPDVMKNYQSGIYTDDESLNEWLYMGVNSLIEYSKKWDGMERINNKLQKLGNNIVKNAIAAGERRLGGFNVICHGDLWMNNMLFSYHPNGDLKDFKFVDFQIVRYTSPAIDLHYFFTTSLSDEVRENCIDNLLDIYYGQFLLSLSEMNYSLDSVPIRQDFKKDFCNRGIYGFLAAATILPIVKASQRDDATFEDLMTSSGPGSFREHCFTNENYKRAMKFILPYFERMGVLG